MISGNNQKKIITEKDFAIKIADDESINIVLSLLNEDIRNGNSDFKRFKFKQVLNKSRVSKKNPQTPWEYICDGVIKKGMESYRGEEIVKEFVHEAKGTPNLVQYLTLRKYDYDFFKNNFEKMMDNVNQNNHFLYGLNKLNSRDVEEYYRKKYLYNENEIDKKIGMLEQSYSKDKKKLTEIKEFLKGFTLQEYDEAITNLEKKFNKGLIQLGFLLTGKLNHEMKSILFMECLNSLLLEESFRRENDEREIKEIIQLEKDKLSNQNKEYKKKILELEKIQKKLLDKTEHLEETISLNLKKYEEEKKQLLKNKNIEWNQLQKINSTLTNENKNLIEKLAKYELLEGNYCLNFAQDFRENKIAVIHASPIVYANYLFPDIKFISASKMIVELQKSNLNLVFVQNSGINYKNKMELKKLAKIYNYEIIFLDSKEERELIMTLSNQLLQLNKK